MLNFNVYDAYSYFFPPATNRDDTIHEIEEKTPLIVENLDRDTIQVLEQKIAELEETNRELELKKEDLLQKRKCCDFRLITWIRWGIGTTLLATIIPAIARLAIKYTQEAATRCLDDRLELLADIETYFLLGFSAFAAWHEVVASKQEHDQIEINEASIIEKFGEVSYNNFLKALKEFEDNKNIDRLKSCIHILDEMPTNRITKKIVRQKLIPNLLCMLPKEDETFQHFMQIIDSEEDSMYEEDSHRFQGEKASKPLLQNNNNTHDDAFKSKWSALEDDLGTRLERLQYKDQIYHWDGKVDSVEQEFTIVEIDEE